MYRTFLKITERIFQQLRFFAIVGLFGCSVSVLAQPAVDSLHLFKSDTVKIIGSAPMLSEMDLPTDISRIRLTKTPQNAGLSEVLSRQNGLFLKSYGGNEATQTISMRGLGAEHTLILLDGVPLGNAQLGVLSLGNYNLTGFSEIDIYRGGNSSLFGSGAVGGVVNIRMTPPQDLQYQLTTGVAAYGQKSVSASLGLPAGKLQHSFGYLKSDSDNQYAFLLDSQNFNRRNSDFSKTQLDYAGWLPLGNNQTVSWQALHIRNDHGAPNAITAGEGFQGRARFDDEQLLLRLKWDARFSGNSRISAQLYRRKDWQQFNDPDLVINGDPLNSRHVNEEWGGTLQFRRKISPSWQAFLGLEASTATATSSDLDESPERQRAAGFALIEWLKPFNSRWMLSAQGAVRSEYFSDFGSVALPKIGAKLHYRNWHGFASVGKNFRAPTFNDLYWQPGGNPDLQPESSVSTEIGIAGDWRWHGKWQPKVNYYHTTLDQMIRWVSGANNIWQPQNLDNVRSRGIETSLNFTTPAKWLNASFHYKYGLSELTGTATANSQLVGNRLPYLPSTEISGMLQLQFANLQLGSDWQFASFRFTTLSNLPAQVLPSYQLLNVFASYHMPLGAYKFTLFGKLDNLLREEFQLIKGYPIPLQQWKIGMKIAYN